MAERGSRTAIVVALIAGGVLFAAAFGFYSRSHEQCSVCARDVDLRLRVLAEVAGRKLRVCCARCALTQGQQERKPVRLIAVSDFNSGREIDPDSAWFVEGGRTTECEYHSTRISQAKRSDRMVFDRCTPGVTAFRSRQDAEAFVAKNGGVVRGLSDLMLHSLPE